MNRPKVYLLSLGCARNLVDSELILGKLRKKRFVIKDEPKDVDLAIINTCAFIKEAKEESIEEILDLIELKKSGEIRKLLVVGCLSQRYREELEKGLPEVDGFLGVGAWKKELNALIEQLVNTDSHGLKPKMHTDKNLYPPRFPRFRLTPPHYSYIKLSEGCDNLCSYCAISQIRGKLHSRPVEEIVKEVKDLSRSGLLKEINLVAQDTTSYGKDIYGKPFLRELLKELEKINSLPWIRVLYMHPAHIDRELIEFIARSERVCHYIDIPLQHISDKILKKMNRKITQKEIYRLIELIREKIKDVSLRTTFIVGFPGENERDFQELIAFIKEFRFEHLGAFIYSREEKTPAYNFPIQVPEEIKFERYNYLLEVQREISLEILKNYIGKEMEVIIDEKVSDDRDRFLGRTEYDAPEVDGGVIIQDKRLKPGDLIQAKVIDTWEYDLLAERAEI
ncbi:MAG: 30S ribosomal protein S12 methylthiotransferase RimO [Candidatus Omnitrophota bacterium]